MAAVPLGVLLQGCSGGGGFSTDSGNSNPTATPTSAATSSNLVLGNGQRATLTTSRVGNNLTGTIQIVAPLTAKGKLSAAAVNFSIKFGSYPITGTVGTDGTFSISGDFGTLVQPPSDGKFIMTGKLQTATTDGSYTLKVAGQTDMGVLPRAGKPFPTPVPTTTPAKGSVTANLTYKGATGEVVSTPITAFNSNDPSNGGYLTTSTISGGSAQVLSLNGTAGPLTGNGTKRLFQVALTSYKLDEIFSNNVKPFSVGQVITFGDSNAPSTIFQYTQTTVQGTSVSFRVWRATGGSATIKAVGTNSATIELKDVQIDPSPIFGGTGSFKLNGTMTGTGLATTVSTQ